MTRKHFEMIAQTLAELISDREYYGTCENAGELVRVFTHTLARTNPRFDRERFANRVDKLTSELVARRVETGA